MNRICNTCNKKLNKKTTWNIEVFAKAVTIKTDEKNDNILIRNLWPKIENVNINNDNNSSVSAYEIITMFLLLQATLVKLITC